MDVDGPASGAAVEETVNGSTGKQQVKEEDRERMLEEKREKFRKVWLGKVVTAFGSELDQLRKVRCCGFYFSCFFMSWVRACGARLD
jgi:L-ribulose-5-phosphate 3-epimerase UlaE